MKENYFCKMKRLLLFAVFMTLPALWQYAGAQVTLQAVDAGFTDGKWWIDLKNPGSTDLSGNGGENDKLGICFYIEKSGGQTTADNATTMRWNDEKTWTIPAGQTVRFTENGGRDNNMDGLTVGNTYYLNIKIQDNGSINDKVSVSWANATFNYQGKQNGIYQISDFTKVSGFDVEAGTGTVLEAGKIYRLEQGTVYTFKNGKTITELWSDAKGSNDKIFTFGWFDTDGKFLGVSGNYEIKNPVETGRAGYNGKYYDIIPVANQGATEVQDRYEHLRYNENGTKLDFTKGGALYLGGSKKGFGIPEANGTYGWDAGDTSANGEIKGSAIPQIGAGKYQFDISTGSQVNAWGDEGEPLLFKIYHYKRWSLPMGDSKDTFTNFEFKHKSGNETFQYDSKTYNQTFYHVEKDTEASPLGGMFEVTRSADPALGNGNIHGIAIGQDSDLPKFPNGYTFRFNLDLTQNAWDFPLQVSLKQRPYDSDVDGTDTWHAGDFTTKTGNVGEIKVCLNNSDGNKRISLRDALRLDWNIPYANSNPYDAENAVKIDKITVTGNMSVDDLYYLGDLVSAGKIANIDLSEASVEGNQIPAGFASMKDDETLKEIILPSGLKTIGAEAFKGCKALVNVIFQEGTGDVMIGSGAFMNCTALNNEQIQNIINHADAVIASDTFNGTNAENITLANDITYIGKQAFANTKLKRFTLPAKCEGKKVEVESYENWVMPGAIGKVFVKSAYSSGKVDENAARKARTIGGDTESLTLQAEDFNQGYGVGWFNNGDHDDRSAANPDYHIDITDTKKGFGIFTSNSDYKLGYMGLDYWFNYSFRVMDEGDYILSAYMATGNDKTVTPSFSIDGGEKVATEVKGGNWTPTQEYNVGSVRLTPGIHYVTFHGVKDSDIDKLVLKKGTDTGLRVITPGQNHGRVVTEYKFTHTDNKVDILFSDSTAFSGVNANNCEVVFPEETTNDMVSGYRDGKNNAGILGLLTKTVSEDAPYDVVYQEHADVKATRTFKTKKWNSVVFPFTVNGKILKNATSEDGTLAEPFARAAYLFDNGFGTPGYDVKLRFVYLDNKNTFDENGTEEIKAGTPFLLFVDDTKGDPAGNVYVFKDITTPAASATVGLGYSGDKVVKQVDPAGEKGITDYSFVGRLDYKAGGDDAFPYKIYWVADSKYYWGKNVTMKNMRSWFKPNNEAGARAIESLFGFVGDDATGISIVEANGGGNVNGGIYSLCGRLISTDPASLPRLPKGVYIVNGNKVIVK